MFVPSFIRIERGLDRGPLLHTKQDACFFLKILMFVPSFILIERG